MLVTRPPATTTRRRPTAKREHSFRDVDDAPSDAEWRALHRVADDHVPRYVEAWGDAVDVLRNPDDAALTAALGRGDSLGAVDALPLDDFDRAYGLAMEALIADLVVAGADVAARFLARRTDVTVVGKQGPDDATLELDFGLINERAVQYGGLRAGGLIRELAPGTLQAVRRVIRAGQLGELTPDEQARLIRDLVGLTDRQVNAALRYADRLRAQGIDGATVRRRLRERAAAMLRQRAENIARTETIRAANYGQRALWEEAAAEGLLDRTRMLQEWIAVVPTDGRTCQICIGLDRERVPLGTTFSTGAAQPPEHVACRCALALVEVDEGVTE